MDTYYRLVNGELIDASEQLFHHHEQLEKERDACRAVADRYRDIVIAWDEANIWKKKAVELAKLVQVFSDEPEVIAGMKAIIDKAEGKG